MNYKTPLILFVGYLIYQVSFLAGFKTGYRTCARNLGVEDILGERMQP